jgi:hypothetical protein
MYEATVICNCCEQHPHGSIDYHENIFVIIVVEFDDDDEHNSQFFDEHE